MSIRNFDAIFRPRAVALIGASNRPGSVGLVTAENLLAGGFDGPIMPVNPKHKAVAGILAYPNINNVPVVPDLIVITTPPATIPGIIHDAGARGTKAAIVITAGFGELGSDQGRALQTAMLEAAKPNLLRIIGPNCLGILSTPAGLNASFAPANARKGGIAFVAQSGAMVTTVLDWANSRGLGFSHLVSLGDMIDVDFGDMLDYLANDPATTAILLYIEAVTDARKFLSAARTASRLKPVIAIKAGRHEAAARAASSHTGALAGVDAVYDAAFQRAGVLRVRDLDEVFDAVETLANPPSLSGERLVILTNGGGAGVLATDSILDYGGKLAELSPQTIAKLDSILPPTWSHGNPVDIIGDAPPKRYADALSILLDAPETDAVLVINCPTAIASSADSARAVADIAAAKKRAVFANWLDVASRPESIAAFAKAGVPAYDTPTEAARGFMHLVRYRKGQETIVEVPSPIETDFIPDDAKARAVVAAALKRGDIWMNPEDVGAILGSYGIPIARTRLVTNEDEAANAAAEIAGAVALKIYSPDVTHKSDVGGVLLNLEGADAVRNAAHAMRARVAAAAPNARIDGFTVQEMVRRPGAYELIGGMAVDRQFGPFLLFGAGGTAVEILADKAIALLPLNLRLARETILQTRISHLLQGYRDHPAVAVDDLALTLVKLSQLASDLDEVVEIDLNPLLADATGVIAVDARIRIQPLAQGMRRGARLAIRPYPKAWERDEMLATFGRLRLRPIRPEDAAALATLVQSLTPEDARLRFFTPVRSMEPRALARFTQIDYEREMAFVLYPYGEPDKLLGVVRLAADPDNVDAEFAIVVRSDLHRRGIGRLLMRRIIEYARTSGLKQLFGDILRENEPMLALATQLGFAIRTADRPEIFRAELQL